MVKIYYNFEFTFHINFNLKEVIVFEFFILFHLFLKYSIMIIFFNIKIVHLFLNIKCLDNDLIKKVHHKYIFIEI